MLLALLQSIETGEVKNFLHHKYYFQTISIMEVRTCVNEACIEQEINKMC